MQKATAQVTLLAFVLSLSACQAQYIPYHSTASIPHYARDVQTDMTLMRRRGENDRRDTRSYGVFAAVDDGEQPYVLLAPMTATYQMENARLGVSAPVLPERADELIAGLDQTLRLWGREIAEREGTFYDFRHAPENEIRRLSENVAEWTPSVHFAFSQTEDGPAARLRIGSYPGSEVAGHLVEFNSREDIEDFRALLQQAQRELRSMVASR